MNCFGFFAFVILLSVSRFAGADGTVEQLKNTPRYYLDANHYLLPYSEGYVASLAKELNIKPQAVQDINGLFMLWLVQHGLPFFGGGFLASSLKRFAGLEEHPVAQAQRYLYIGALAFEHFRDMPATLGTVFFAYLSLFHFCAGGKHLPAYGITGSLEITKTN